MRVYELAKEYGIPNKEMLAKLRARGVDVNNHLSEVPNLERVREALRSGVAAAPPGPPVASATHAPPSVAGATTATPASVRPPLLAFGSLKGGVGKTTMSLCAVELLRPEWPVIVIDADVAGTELHWVWNEESRPDGKPAVYRVASSLVGILRERPDRDDELSALLAVARTLDKGHGLVVPTFARRTESTLEALQWKGVLEDAGECITQSLARIVRELRKLGAAVVVDLPAFDVGFAHYARGAIEQEEGTYFLVTDADVRSLRATLDYLRVYVSGADDSERWGHVVVNGVPDSDWQDTFWEKLARAIAYTDGDDIKLSTDDRAWRAPVIARRRTVVREATEFGGEPAELFKAIQRFIADEASLSKADRRRLRGEKKKS